MINLNNFQRKKLKDRRPILNTNPYEICAIIIDTVKKLYKRHTNCIVIYKKEFYG